MSIIIRHAKIDDIEAIVPYIKLASGGISEFLLTQLIPGMSVDDLIEMALTDDNSTYHYQNILVAELNDKIIGAANYYPAELHCLPDIMRSHISKEKLDLILSYFNSKLDDSMYIHTLAVDPNYRHTSCAVILGKKIEIIAKQQKKKCLSAHVWQDNTPVLLGLKIAGFKKIQDIHIPYHAELPHKGGMALLKGPDF